VILHDPYDVEQSDALQSHPEEQLGKKLKGKIFLTKKRIKVNCGNRRFSQPTSKGWKTEVEYSAKILLVDPAFFFAPYGHKGPMLCQIDPTFEQLFEVAALCGQRAGCGIRVQALEASSFKGRTAVGRG